MQFTDDKDVLSTLNLLDDTRSGALPAVRSGAGTIQPNFRRKCSRAIPATATSINHSTGDARGPWNEGESTGLGEEALCLVTRASRCSKPTDSRSSNRRNTPHRRLPLVRSADKKLSKERSGEIRKATPEKNLRWCEHEPQDTKASRRQPVEQD